MSKFIARTVSKLHNEEDVIEVKSLEGEVKTSLDLTVKDMTVNDSLHVKNYAINAVFRHLIPLKIGDGSTYVVEIISSKDSPYTIGDELLGLIKGKIGRNNQSNVYTSMLFLGGTADDYKCIEVILGLQSGSPPIIDFEANVGVLSITDEYYPIPIMEELED